MSPRHGRLHAEARSVRDWIAARIRVRQLDRRELAASLRHLARDGCAPAGYSARIPTARIRVAEARPDLERLASRLAGPDPVDARGVDLTQELLSDGTGPLFWNRSAESLKARLREALEALEPRA